MLVAAEVYSALAFVPGDLNRVIDAFSTATSVLGFDFYDIGLSIDINNVPHRLVDVLWPLIPIVVQASALHTNEETPRLAVKQSICEQIFYLARAKQDMRKGAHVLVRRHGIEAF